jgi:putative Ca2+/H+ antiporter (TMEM165/GDT1 family)
MHALRIAAYVFVVIFVAELPDKTALAALVLATRRKALPVFLGSSLALTVQSAIAVLAGGLLSLLPERAVHYGAGAVFFVSAVVMWVRKEEHEPADEEGAGSPGGAGSGPPPSAMRDVATSFGVVFVAEWGDLTQFATAAFATREHAPWVVFAASSLALWAVTAIAVGIGHQAGKLLDPTLTKRVAAVLFALVGVALFCGWI